VYTEKLVQSAVDHTSSGGKAASEHYMVVAWPSESSIVGSKTEETDSVEVVMEEHTAGQRATEQYRLEEVAVEHMTVKAAAE
jgi:hypothetical protein